MSTTIWKFPLKLEDEQTIEVPGGYAATMLCVQLQRGPCLWARVNTDARPCPVTILMRGTGFALAGDEGAYLGTVLIEGGVFMTHVFMGKP